jgi:hypothetical protein
VTWTPELDAILKRTIDKGGRYADAARAVRSATRGRFAPHATTCLRRLRALRPVVSTRVDTEEIPSRVRAPLALRSTLPVMQVLTLPLEVVEKRELRGAVDDAMYAETPGSSWEIVEDGAGDAYACARHRATLRGDDLVVLERDRASIVVAVRGPLDRSARQLVMVVVRHVRAA